MIYRYFAHNNYEYLAAGRVLRHSAGYSNYPVRLAGEIFMRCLAAAGVENRRVVLYDPCCGSAYLLTVLGFLCGASISEIYASDLSADAVALAGENLSLLTPEGQKKRTDELACLYAAYRKDSHSQALKSAEYLAELIGGKPVPKTHAFTADALDATALKAAVFTADIVLTDVPYGALTSWSEDASDAIAKLLTTILPVISRDSIIAISSDKGQRISHSSYKRIERLNAGKRKIELLRLV